jgi:hypothetical protein
MINKTKVQSTYFSDLDRFTFTGPRMRAGWTQSRHNSPINRAWLDTEEVREDKNQAKANDEFCLFSLEVDPSLDCKMGQKMGRGIHCGKRRNERIRNAQQHSEDNNNDVAKISS